MLFEHYGIMLHVMGKCQPWDLWLFPIIFSSFRTARGRCTLGCRRIFLTLLSQCLSFSVSLRLPPSIFSLIWRLDLGTCSVREPSQSQMPGVHKPLGGGGRTQMVFAETLANITELGTRRMVCVTKNVPFSFFRGDMHPPVEFNKVHGMIPVRGKSSSPISILYREECCIRKSKLLKHSTNVQCCCIRGYKHQRPGGRTGCLWGCCSVAASVPPAVGAMT